MKLKVDHKSDALYFRLDESAVVESEEIKPGIILDYGAKGNVVGIEILNLSDRVPKVYNSRQRKENLSRSPLHLQLHR